MDYVLEGFTNELLKLAGSQSAVERESAELRSLYRDVKKKSQGGASDAALKKIRGKGREVSRDYLASAMIGATAGPAAVLLGGKLSRKLHNRDVIKAMKGLSGKRKKQIAKHLELGPTIGKTKIPGIQGQRPIMTHPELAGSAARGAAMGSVIQMIRDRFSGSAGKGDK